MSKYHEVSVNTRVIITKSSFNSYSSKYENDTKIIALTEFGITITRYRIFLSLKTRENYLLVLTVKNIIVNS